jgi:hypothetical protein
LSALSRASASLLPFVVAALAIAAPSCVTINTPHYI